MIENKEDAQVKIGGEFINCYKPNWLDRRITAYLEELQAKSQALKE
jgi:hypothetical protein